MPTWTFGGFATAGSRVVWVANGCLLVDDAGAPPAAAPGPGPCLRSEIALDLPAASRTRTSPAPPGHRALRRRAAGLPRRAAVDHAAGRRAMTAISRRVRFSIPAGQTRRLRVPLTCRGYRRMRRTLARESTVIVDLDARTGDGERYVGDLWYEHVLGPGRSERAAAPAPLVAGRVSPRASTSVRCAATRCRGTRCSVRARLDLGSPSDGNVRLFTELRSAAASGSAADHVQRVQSGHDIPEDSVRCIEERDRDPSARRRIRVSGGTGRSGVHTWPGVTVSCNAGWKTRARAAARAT